MSDRNVTRLRTNVFITKTCTEINKCPHYNPTIGDENHLLLVCSFHKKLMMSCLSVLINIQRFGNRQEATPNTSNLEYILSSVLSHSTLVDIKHWKINYNMILLKIITEQELVRILFIFSRQVLDCNLFKVIVNTVTII